jgi:CheY-like chemotaxis protein
MEPPLILIVEDEKDIARFIELELQAEGYRTEVAHDGITGLSKFREVNPNLVILDLMLPVMDGIEVARRIRKTSNVPILILTAKDRVEDKVLGLDAGADDYLVKPFSIEELSGPGAGPPAPGDPRHHRGDPGGGPDRQPRGPGGLPGGGAGSSSPTRSLNSWNSWPRTRARSSPATK